MTFEKTALSFPSGIHKGVLLNGIRMSSFWKRPLIGQETLGESSVEGFNRGFENEFCTAGQ